MTRHPTNKSSPLKTQLQDRLYTHPTFRLLIARVTAPLLRLQHEPPHRRRPFRRDPRFNLQRPFCRYRRAVAHDFNGHIVFLSRCRLKDHDNIDP